MGVAVVGVGDAVVQSGGDDREWAGGVIDVGQEGDRVPVAVLGGQEVDLFAQDGPAAEDGDAEVDAVSAGVAECGWIGRGGEDGV